MGVVTARIVFLAFLGLTGTIIYNALYLQEPVLRGVASIDAPTEDLAGATQTISVIPRTEPADFEVPPPVRQPNPPPVAGGMASVSTDLPPLAPNTAESQLIVRAVQRELAARGYDVGAVDGNLSEKTRAAIAAFQSSQGLVVTGQPSDDLLRQILLGDSVAPAAATGSLAQGSLAQGSLAQGSLAHGSLAQADSIAANASVYETVKTVQQTLADLGYAPGPVDGAWGQNTARAISAFQRDRNLAQTGQITPELLGEFQRVTGRDFTSLHTPQSISR